MNITTKNYDRLCDLVDSGKLEVVHVVGLPRTNGTALHIAITQAKEASGQVNEPLFYPDLKGRKWDYRPTEKAVRTLDDGCGFILKSYEEHAAETVGTVKLIVHDLSQDISEDEFLKLKKIDKHTVFMVRDPLLNALSMLTRYANDKLSQPGGAQLKSHEVLAFMKDEKAFVVACKMSPCKLNHSLIAQLVQKEESLLDEEDFKLARKKVLDIAILEFSLAWENIHHFYKMMDSESLSKTRSVFDASWLFDKPEVHLKDLVGRIGGLTYTPDMINRWTKGVGDKFRCIITSGWGSFAQTNAWNGPVRNSTGIVKQKESVSDEVRLDQFPEEVQSTIELTQKMYKEIRGSLL